jgi:undecaprenyl-diphosphatase
MNWLQALVLGAVQGLTEFLPVSSSGHLQLFQIAMDVQQNPLLFDTLLHVGTLVAVVVFLWKDVWALIRRPIQPVMGYLVVATIPAVIAAVFFGDEIEAAFASSGGLLLGIGFLVSAILMFATPLFRPGKLEMEKMGVLRPLWMGVMQAVAILPSVSRSGGTIFAGMSSGIKREDVARFSFLMSIPAILGSVVLNIKDIASLGTGMATDAPGLLVVLAGMAAAAVTGWLALKVVIDTIKKGKLWLFGVYTAALGILVIFDAFVTHVIFKSAF